MNCYSQLTVYLELAVSLFICSATVLLLFNLVFGSDQEEGSDQSTDYVEPIDNAPATHDLPTIPEPLPAYPPPPDFPFKNFRATGESFGCHDFSQPLYPMDIPRTTYPRRDSFHTEAKEPTDAVACLPTQDDKTSNKETSSSSKDSQTTIKASKVSFVDVVVAKPAHKAVEQPPQLAHTPTHALVTPAITTPLNAEIIQAPLAPAPRPEIIQVGLSAVESSAQDMQIGMLELVAAQEFKMMAALDFLFVAFNTNGAYREPALHFLSMMEEAKTNLLPFFPNGLTGLNTDRLIWTKSLLAFWEALRPYGYEFQVSPEEDVRMFLIRYHDLASWMGLGHLLHPFIVNVPPTPESIQAPPPPPPAITIQHLTPPGSFQAPSFSAPAVPHPAPEPIQAPLPLPFSFQGLPPPTQAVLKPATQARPSSLRSLCPRILQGPFILIKAGTQACTDSLRSHGPRILRGSLILIKAGTQTHIETLRAPSSAPHPTATSRATPPGLLNFDAFDWLNQSDDALNALTAESFQWSDTQQAAYKIWSYSTVGQLRLPPIDSSFINHNLVKAALNNIAPMFKRASVVLHIQRTIVSPHEDILSMVPLLGEVQALLEAAEKMTNDCEELVVYDQNDPWYHACMYFRSSIITSKVINRLRDYRSDMRTDVKELWGRMKAEWVGDTSGN
ncbi:predicted protein [Pyrenophora tritici-repentis Pt-1C-BFP]|uniref:Uncharacterized protein n=3 Tax=Pyrenophora tritici-repentis TaxID=45151 RepID=A0A922NLC4_9PLEO|nr:uncharacterized protein PTRG_02152 [Pyrenophora tritici-repentis Pt-1C-BFP]EDU41590.1 predicted protein [Pyrenophora tritici-repentis Pt-1C-BFP]KAI1517815.1 hypothetical protein Ptr86124_003116 [Pyrenophora tritici-repentis]